ncbi:hypothetical protein EUGRSUZ_D01002 [Eucalyptus grandis]|uniref:Uncharacterized protein n=2 Tax=Eucalyptus grandis TaxID=71139 RepID=A0ACC3L4J9_EUCGR|nr:hypothetical protein EUGRSUZ_D01002 [Eucalyptus grandis]
MLDLEAEGLPSLPHRHCRLVAPSLQPDLLRRRHLKTPHRHLLRCGRRQTPRRLLVMSLAPPSASQTDGEVSDLALGRAGLGAIRETR